MRDKTRINPRCEPHIDIVDDERARGTVESLAQNHYVGSVRPLLSDLHMMSLYKPLWCTPMDARDLSRAGAAAESCVEGCGVRDGGEGEAVECGIKPDQYRQKRDTVANPAAYAKPAKRNGEPFARRVSRLLRRHTHTHIHTHARARARTA